MYKTEKIKIRVIAPVFLAILMVAILAVVIIQKLHSERILADVTSNIARAYAFLQHYVKEKTELLSSVNSDIRHNRNLQLAWQAKDRQKLLQFAKPVLDEINNKYHVSHFYFIGLDKKTFLRVHKPSRHGDTINRFTLQKAFETGEAGTGIELGPLGTLTLRFVYPWKIKGRHVGYIEVGQEVDHIIKDISELLKVKIIVAVNKNLLDKSLWQNERNAPGSDNNWDGTDSLVVISSTIKNKVSSQWHAYTDYIKRHDHTDYSPITHSTSDRGHDFSAGFIPMFNAAGNDIGDILVISDNDTEQVAIRKFTNVLVLSAAFIALLLCVSFYQYIGGIERRLQTSRKKLIAESKTREKTLSHARDVAEETNRMKSQFLANMSHEIRTPMNGVMGMLQLLNDTSLNQDQQECTEVALKSANTLVTLLNDILDLSKIDAGKLTIEEIPFDVRTTLEDVTESLYGQASKKGLELYCLIDASIPIQVLGDPYRLRQILTNLISNAIKFTQHGKVVVRLGTSVDSDGRQMLSFEVSDTGIGIPAEAQNSIFSSFVQADGSTTRHFGGTGLGLTISKKLVEHMGGEIHVKSSSGTGSTFYFSLPMKQAEVGRPEEMPFQRINGQRVLLLNSTAEMEKVMSALGLRVERVEEDPVSFAELEKTVLDRLQAARVAGEAFPIVVLEQQGESDTSMEMAKAIRANTENTDTHLVLLTALGQRGDGDAARLAGFEGFLTKPIRQSVLHDCIATILGFGNQSRKVMVTSHSLKEQHHHEKMHILLAEDDEVSQIVVCAMLKKLGYRVDVADNGSEVLKALNNTSYQLILMDCQMPEMDGYQATKAIRNSKEVWKDIPVVALTANALAGDREKCIAAGMDEYLTKPIELKVLETVLLRVLYGTSQDQMTSS